MLRSLMTTSLMAALLALPCLTPNAAADDEDSNVKVTGKVVIVGPDGESKTFDLTDLKAGKATAPAVPGCPGCSKMSDLMKKAMKHAKSDGNVKVAGKIMMMGPDGEMRTIDLSDLKGPDGAELDFFGGADLEKFHERIQRARKRFETEESGDTEDTQVRALEAQKRSLQRAIEIKKQRQSKRVEQLKREIEALRKELRSLDN